MARFSNSIEPIIIHFYAEGGHPSRGGSAIVRFHPSLWNAKKNEKRREKQSAKINRPAAAAIGGKCENGKLSRYWKSRLGNRPAENATGVFFLVAFVLNLYFNLIWKIYVCMYIKILLWNMWNFPMKNWIFQRLSWMSLSVNSIAFWPNCNLCNWSLLVMLSMTVVANWNVTMSSTIWNIFQTINTITKMHRSK